MRKSSAYLQQQVLLLAELALAQLRLRRKTEFDVELTEVGLNS